MIWQRSGPKTIDISMPSGVQRILTLDSGACIDINVLEAVSDVSSRLSWMMENALMPSVLLNTPRYAEPLNKDTVA